MNNKYKEDATKIVILWYVKSFQWRIKSMSFPQTHTQILFWNQSILKKLNAS